MLCTAVASIRSHRSKPQQSQAANDTTQRFGHTITPICAVQTVVHTAHAVQHCYVSETLAICKLSLTVNSSCTDAGCKEATLLCL